MRKEQRLDKVALTSGVEGEISMSAKHILMYANTKWNMKR